MKQLSDQNKNRLANYSAFAAAIVAAGAAQGQVIFTDVNPDSVHSYNDFYDLDVDNNAAPDFRITLSFYSTSGTFTGSWVNSTNPSSYSTYGSYFRSRFKDVNIQMFGTNSVVGTMGSGYAAPMIYGSTIGPTLATSQYWASTTRQFGYSRTSYQFSWYWWTDGATSGAGSNGPYTNTYYEGAWGGQTRFIGLQFDIGGNTHYGWCRIAVDFGYNGFTVMDYAYESTPDVKIDAGSVNSYVGIDESLWTEGVHIFNHQDILNIKFLGHMPANATLEILDITGRMVETDQLTDAISTKDVSGLTAGIYIVNVRSGEEVFSKKIYVR